MRIHRATKIALNTGRYIRDLDDKSFGEYVIYKPSAYADEGFVVYGFHKKPCPRWNPTPRDIMSRGWQVVDLPNGWMPIPPPPAPEKPVESKSVQCRTAAQRKTRAEEATATAKAKTNTGKKDSER